MSNVVRFKADEVALDPRVGFLGFVNNTEKRYFWIQPSEMTTAKGEIWLERDDQQWGGCGRNWNVVLTRNLFTAITNGLPPLACDAVQVEFQVDNAKYSAMKELLRQVMVDCQSDLAIQE
jgi:hypothetical protein